MRPGLLAVACVLCASTTAHADDPDGEEPQSVTVSLRSADPQAVLEHQPTAERSRDWRALCIAPCKATVDLRDGLRVAGSDVDPMYMHFDEPGSYDVVAETGSAGMESAGVALLISGATMMLLGGVAIIALEQGGGPSGEDDDPGVIMLHASVTTLVAGAVIFAAGVPFRAAGASGDLSITPSSEQRVELGAGLSLSAKGLHF